MKNVFRVALVGRPNVGKSTLFNKIVGKRKALTFGRPGITRDSVSEKVEVRGKVFELVDTGGYVPDAAEDLPVLVKRQVVRAMEEADLIVFVMDGKEGPSSVEGDILEILRNTGKKYLIALNKADSKKTDENLPLFYELGVEDFIRVSAEHGTGVEILLEEIVKRVPRDDEKEKSINDKQTHVSIVGRPNVGKSTLLNAIIGWERVIASPVPGTTRDTIDVEILVGGRSYLFLDTAGIRPRRKTGDAVDKITSIRSIKTIGKAHVLIVVIDSTEGPTHNDQQITRYAVEEGKGIVLAANKIDALPVKKRDEVIRSIEDDFSFARFIPIVPVSGMRKRGIGNLFKEVSRVYSHYTRRIRTPDLNKKVGEKVFRKPIPGGRKTNRAYYMIQSGTEPPSFTLFVKDTENIPESFTRFVSNRIREVYEFRGCPIRIFYRRK